jgi:hypothetical protein
MAGGFLFLLALGALLSGCAQTQQFTPSAAPARYHLHGLPANIVAVQVNDLRPEQSASDALPQVLKAQQPVFSAKYPPVHAPGKGPQSLVGAPQPEEVRDRSGH